MPQRTARNTKALAKSCRYVVSPLSSAPWAYPVSKRLWKLRYTGKEWETPSDPKWSHARPAKWIKRTQKYGHLSPKIVISTPPKALCVDLVGPYTLKSKDGTSIDFMALTMINHASSWFELWNYRQSIVDWLILRQKTVKREQSKKKPWISHLIE